MPPWWLPNAFRMIGPCIMLFNLPAVLPHRLCGRMFLVSVLGTPFSGSRGFFSSAVILAPKNKPLIVGAISPFMNMYINLVAASGGMAMRSSRPNPHIPSEAPLRVFQMAFVTCSVVSCTSILSCNSGDSVWMCVTILSRRFSYTVVSLAASTWSVPFGPVVGCTGCAFDARCPYALDNLASPILFSAFFAAVRAACSIDSTTTGFTGLQAPLSIAVTAFHLFPTTAAMRVLVSCVVAYPYLPLPRRRNSCCVATSAAVAATAPSLLYPSIRATL